MNPLPAVDLSRWNGAPDWPAFEREGCALVIAKCTELHPDGSLYLDPDYYQNREAAKRIGARFAAYHFAHPGSSAAESLELFAEHAMLRPGDIPVLDLETSDGLGVEAVAQWGSAWSHAAYGAFRCWPWVYSDQDFLLAGNLDGCKTDPLWIAVLGYAKNTPPHFDGFNTVMVQERWGSGGNSDTVFLRREQLASYAIPNVPELVRRDREHALISDLHKAESDLAKVGRLGRLLGLGGKR